MFAQSAIDTRLHPLDAVRAVGRLLANPNDTRQVFTIFRSLRGRSAIRTFARFAESPTGADLLRRRPLLLAALEDRTVLAQLPAGSVGRTYLAFMEREHLSAGGLVQASEGNENDGAPADIVFFRNRMRDAHDLTHVITGYGRDPLGEMCLLAFMYAHTRNLGMALIVAMGWLKLPKAARAAVSEAWRNGRKAQWFQNQDFEALLSRPLDDVRRELTVATPAAYLALEHRLMGR